MKISTCPMDGLALVETRAFTDQRGAFARLYCERELDGLIDGRRIVQINHSRTNAVGAVRGMHFQRPPAPKMKMVHCVRGRDRDVAVDLRRGSPTFLKWHPEELSPANAKVFAIAEGFAHGFQALEEDLEFLYLHTALYAPEAEGGVRPGDPKLAISWPPPFRDLSARDSGHPFLSVTFQGLPI